ncbi:MAG: beta-galactosidase [Nitrososphaerota archaeon]|nr:beta-galactosidase [Candidatus Bathyarchaeota archaeon]MDW8049337.1 beta-galactosidase [Nitrososphaerota archaeon]
MKLFPFGIDYYPEHWPERRWPIDVALMKNAGFNVVRLAEFAWSKMEPREGEYNFEWLDKAINMLSSNGMRIILGTPTAAPPPWIVKAHPDILRVDGHGRRAPEGTRRNYCPNNPHYNKHSERIVEAMVFHYRENRNVIGWQVDNEFAGDPCYCNNCINAFREWLRTKYESIDRVNEECGLIFWGQEYGDWDEIYPPKPPLSMQSPSLSLEWQRFTSDCWIKYEKMQVDIIRKYAPHQFVTHNFMGMYRWLNYFKLAEPLDFVSFDYYPWRKTYVNLIHMAMSHDIMRSLKKKPYWIMELQSGAIKSSQAPIPLPGQIRLWTFQSIARGADGILYFRWRSCRFGSEEYWHGILDHDGVPRRRYNEIKRTAEEIHKLAPYLEGTVLKPEIAITLVYDALWAWDLEITFGDMNYYGRSAWEPTLDLYGALYRRNVLVDFVDPESEELGQYRVLLVPSLMLMNKKVEENLRSYVKNGGTLIATPRTGAKNWNNIIVEETLPGALSDVFGVTIEEYTGVPDEEKIRIETSENWLGKQKAYECGKWAEMLAPEKAAVIANYRTGIYDNKPAATVNRYGKGTAMYIGIFAEEGFYLDLVDWLISQGKAKSIMPSATGFEATERRRLDCRIVFALNHTQNSISIPCEGKEFKDILSGQRVGDRLDLKAFDVKFLIGEMEA